MITRISDNGDGCYWWWHTQTQPLRSNTVIKGHCELMAPILHHIKKNERFFFHHHTPSQDTNADEVVVLPLIWNDDRKEHPISNGISPSSPTAHASWTFFLTSTPNLMVMISCHVVTVIEWWWWWRYGDGGDSDVTWKGQIRPQASSDQ